MQNNIPRLITLCKVAEFKSFTRAAQALKQPKSRVSRNIAALEDNLKLQLVIRSTRRVSLTQAGQELVQNVSPLLSGIQEELQQAEQSSKMISGTLNISAPEDIGQLILPDLIIGYRRLFPNVAVNVRLSNHYVDFHKDSIDLAFRIGRLKDSSHRKLHLTSIQLICVASKVYFQHNPKPKSVSDLKHHKQIGFLLETGAQSFAMFNKKTTQIASSNYPFVYKMVLRHQGIAVLPRLFCTKDLANQSIEQIFPRLKLPESPLQLVYPYAKNMPLKTRSFIDYVKAHPIDI